MVLDFLIGATAAAILAVAAYPNACPPKLEIGQTYAQIKAGPCPDIEPRAFDRRENVVSYFCPSLKVAVLGSVVTGKAIGFVQIDFDPRDADR